MLVMEHKNPEPVFFNLERSCNCIQSFVKNLQKLAKDFYELEQLHRMYIVPPQLSSNASWIFERDLFESGKI